MREGKFWETCHLESPLPLCCISTSAVTRKPQILISMWKIQEQYSLACFFGLSAGWQRWLTIQSGNLFHSIGAGIENAWRWTDNTYSHYFNEAQHVKNVASTQIHRERLWKPLRKSTLCIWEATACTFLCVWWNKLWSMEVYTEAAFLSLSGSTEHLLYFAAT